jgi:hypothetical protein
MSYFANTKRTHKYQNNFWRKLHQVWCLSVISAAPHMGQGMRGRERLSCEPAWEENEEAIDAEFAKISDKIQ